jgi:hypothetical protein
MSTESRSPIHFSDLSIEPKSPRLAQWFFMGFVGHKKHLRKKINGRSFAIPSLAQKIFEGVISYYHFARYKHH